MISIQRFAFVTRIFSKRISPMFMPNIRCLSSENRTQSLISPQWLAAQLDRQVGMKIKILDASWRMPNEVKDIYADHERVRLPGSVLFDIDKIADKSVDLPHMLPSVEQFEKQVGELGITNDDFVIAYDSSGKFVASARVWWTFKVFGHKNVAVLEGGLPKWLSKKLPTESGAPLTLKQQVYKATYNPEMVATIDQIRENIKTDEAEVLDARPVERFFGSIPEPRPGMKSGHIPHSKSVPWTAVLDTDHQSYLPNEELVKTLFWRSVDITKPIITTCGSGVTASVISFALHLCGIDTAVYDGSFSEWGRLTENNPVAEGGGNEEGEPDSSPPTSSSSSPSSSPPKQPKTPPSPTSPPLNI
eukprot:TRINITY_DN7044_c0_g1_i1.p1 TRINITY_DN7044_c0_g1~~TRINITY_DN7044_c0_g1_i1.p1  ORF type:complete len:360 (+),score=95.75 TRINITY_DN7044_c0_g1_i1:92-1171(+)